MCHGNIIYVLAKFYIVLKLPLQRFFAVYERNLITTLVLLASASPESSPLYFLTLQHSIDCILSHLSKSHSKFRVYYVARETYRCHAHLPSCKTSVYNLAMCVYSKYDTR